jgi:hygromycin-B 4-O-kinase
MPSKPTAAEVSLPGTKRVSANQIREAKRMVRSILAHHLNRNISDGGKIMRMGGGLTNLVFSVHDGRENLIVRLGANAAKLSTFLKEQWAIAKAREAGVPAPEVLQVGNEAATAPYMIARRSKGRDAATHPSRPRIVRELGNYAAVINSIHTSGFGSTFDWSHNQLSYNETWSGFLENELKLDERLSILESSGMLEPARLKKLRATLTAAGKERRPALNHGDLRLKNVLVNDQGKISSILDWEHCTSNLAPEWELSLALHDLSIDEKQELLDGYGLTAARITELSPLFKALNLINYAPTLERAMKSKNNLKLDHIRSRFASELDLYSL